MTIKVNFDECEANAVCLGIAPKLFDLDDEDNLSVLDDTPPESEWERVRSAVASCPKRALAFVEAAPADSE